MTTHELDAMVTQTADLGSWLDASTRPDLPVPTCPGWTLTDLVGHVGTTQRWVTRMVDEGVDDFAAAFALTVDDGLPADPADWAEWLTAGAEQARVTLAGAPDGSVVLDPSGGGDGLAFWSRRLFGEISVHRIDAATALDRPYAIEPAEAADAIEDWLSTIASSGWAANVPGFADAMRGDGRTIAWVADDVDRAWLLRRSDAPLVLTHQRAEADATVSGPAHQLLEVVSRRRPLDTASACTVRGDRAELDHLIEHMVWIGA